MFSSASLSIILELLSAQPIRFQVFFLMCLALVFCEFTLAPSGSYFFFQWKTGPLHQPYLGSSCPGKKTINTSIQCPCDKIATKVNFQPQIHWVYECSTFSQVVFHNLIFFVSASKSTEWDGCFSRVRSINISVFFFIWKSFLPSSCSCWLSSVFLERFLFTLPRNQKNLHLKFDGRNVLCSCSRFHRAP